MICRPNIAGRRLAASESNPAARMIREIPTVQATRFSAPGKVRPMAVGLPPVHIRLARTGRPINAIVSVVAACFVTS